MLKAALDQDWLKHAAVRQTDNGAISNSVAENRITHRTPEALPTGRKNENTAVTIVHRQTPRRLTGGCYSVYRIRNGSCAKKSYYLNVQKTFLGFYPVHKGNVSWPVCAGTVQWPIYAGTYLGQYSQGSTSACIHRKLS